MGSPGVTRLPTWQSCQRRWNLRPNLNFTKFSYVKWYKSLTFSNGSFLTKQPKGISIRRLHQGFNELHVLDQKIHSSHSETWYFLKQVTSTRDKKHTMLWAESTVLNVNFFENDTQPTPCNRWGWGKPHPQDPAVNSRCPDTAHLPEIGQASSSTLLLNHYLSIIIYLLLLHAPTAKVL